MRKAAGAVLAATLAAMLLVLPSVAVAQTRNVRIENLDYADGSDNATFAYPGDVVRWQHRDGNTPHTVTADDGSFDSSRNATNGSCATLLTRDDCLYQGDSFSNEFSEVGTYGYHCKIHGSMRGTVRVVPRGQPTTPVTTSPASPTPTKSVSVTPTGTGTATGTGSAMAVPTGTGSATLTEPPRAGGPDDGSSNGRIVIAAVGVLLLSAAGFLVYRRFIMSP